MALPASQLEWLEHDIAEIRRLIEEHPEFARPLGDLRDPNLHAKYLVVADLAWQVWFLVMGAHQLLREVLVAPLLVVQRATFEALVALAYLVSRNNIDDESVIFIAYSMLREIEAFPDQGDLVAQRQSVLERMPRRLVQVARRRIRDRPHTWSGLTIARMSREGQVRGYREMYGILSAHAHVSIVGHHVRVEPEGADKIRVVTGNRLRPIDVESHANFSRRALHSTFRTLWGVFDAPPIQFRSEDPDLWLRQTEPPI